MLLRYCTAAAGADIVAGDEGSGGERRGGEWGRGARPVLTEQSIPSR